MSEIDVSHIPPMEVKPKKKSSADHGESQEKTEFAGNYDGPLYAPHPDVKAEKEKPAKPPTTQKAVRPMTPKKEVPQRGAKSATTVRP